MLKELKLKKLHNFSFGTSKKFANIEQWFPKESIRDYKRFFLSATFLKREKCFEVMNKRFYKYFGEIRKKIEEIDTAF